MEETLLSLAPKSLEEALEQTLNGFPIEQFTFIEITRKNFVKRAFDCLEDEDLKPSVTVKFIGRKQLILEG